MRFLSRSFKNNNNNTIYLFSFDELNHIVNLLGRRRQILIPLLRNEDIILDPHAAHSPVLLEHSLVNVLGLLGILEVRLDDEPAKVDARLDGDDAAGGHGPAHAQVAEHGVLVGVVRVAARVVRVHAQVVAQAVREEGDAGARLEDVVGGEAGAQDAQVLQPRDGDLVRELVDRVPEDARFERRDALLLHREDDAVDGAALVVEGAAQRERARDVRGVVVDLAAGVQEEDVLGGDGRVVLDVVERGAVLAGRDDGVVGLVFGVALDAGLEEDGFEFGLAVGRRRRLHGVDVAHGRDGVGFADQGDFVVGLDHAARFDAALDEVQVGRFEGQERGAVRDLVGDGEDGALRRGFGRGEVRVQLVRRLDVVYVVLGLCLGR